MVLVPNWCVTSAGTRKGKMLLPIIRLCGGLTFWLAQKEFRIKDYNFLEFKKVCHGDPMWAHKYFWK